MHDTDDAFQRFVEALNAALPALLDAEPPRLRVKYAPFQTGADFGEILLGLGTTGRYEDTGVVLQHKGSPYRSVTAYVRNAPAAQVDNWRRRLSEPTTVSDLQATLYVEDASPDTMLSLVFFLARLFGVTTEALPALWCDYATRWETGDVRTTGQPFGSWGCLQSALSHSYSTERGKERTGVEMAFPVCLRYLLGLIALGVDPGQVPEELPLAEHHAARLQLQQEYQAYQHMLASAELLQLRVPLPGDRRFRLVDTYIATEVLELGASKVFIRNDEEHTWFKQGFSLMALYRPLANPGEDITVSTDPTSGIHLQDLWKKLEEMENQRWGEARPRDTPRKLRSYPDGKDEKNNRPAPNQPWYDGGDYTLVAAPKALGEKHGNQPGSKLNWQDVREQLWACYNPAIPLRFKRWDDHSHGPGQALHAIPAAIDGDKRLLLVGWDPWNSEPLVLTPTLQRYLAACAANSHPDGVPLDALPDLSTFDFLKMPGGFAVIHRSGVLLMDDWSSTALDVAACQEEFRLLHRRLQTIECIDRETTQLVTTLKGALDKGSALPYRDMVQRLSRQRLQLHTELFDTSAQSEDVHVLNFRALLEKRWGLSGQLTELQSTLEQLDEMVRNHLELRTSSLVNALTIYGFPIALVASIFSSNVLQNWGNDGSWLGGIHWHGLWLSLGVCLSLIALVKLISYLIINRGRFRKT
ncbi:MAG TPA: hypothetical protein PLS42_09095 [Candidatus Competibacter denitrificans]|nr:hypothetical protein [Candidatus Competibacter denitrificans]